MTDEQLMERVVTGDMMAMGELFERHKQPLFGFLFRCLHDHAAAEDAVLDVFLRVHDRCRTYKHNAKFTTWLYTIAHHLAIDLLRRNKRREKFNDPLPEHAADPSSLHEDFERDELGRVIRTAVNALPADQRMVILLREYQGFSYREIAEVTHASEQTVRVRAHRARQVLRQRLAPYISDNDETPVTFAAVPSYNE